MGNCLAVHSPPPASGDGYSIHGRGRAASSGATSAQPSQHAAHGESRGHWRRRRRQSAATATSEANFIAACAADDTASVRRFLSTEGADVNRAVDGALPLVTACASDSYEVVLALLDAGAFVYTIDKRGLTPLSAAVSAPSVRVVTRLLEAGADPSAPFVGASADGRRGNSSASPSMPGGGSSCLEYSARRGHLSIANLLLRYGATDADGRALLAAACAHGGAEDVGARAASMVRVLLSSLCSASTRAATTTSMTATTTAAGAAGGPGTSDRMEKYVLSRDADGNTALHWAARHGQLDIVRVLFVRIGGRQQRALLLEARNHRGMSAFDETVAAGRISVAAELLHQGAQPDMRRAMYMAATVTDDAAAGGVISFLASRGAHADAVDDERRRRGLTPLLAAIDGDGDGANDAVGRVQTVRRLLAVDADATRREPRSGRNALMLAAARGHDRVVSQLLQASGDGGSVADSAAAPSAAGEETDGAGGSCASRELDIDARDAHGHTALTLADGYPACAEELLRHGAAYDAAHCHASDAATQRVIQRYVSGAESALTLAAAQGNMRTVHRLLRQRARDRRRVNVDAARVHDGRTPLMLAARHGHVLIVRELLGAGARVDQRSRQGSTALLECALGVGSGRAAVADDEDERDGGGGGDEDDRQSASGEIVRELVVRARADIRARKVDGWDALVCAAWSGNVTATRELLRCGADPNASSCTSERLIGVDNDEVDDEGHDAATTTTTELPLEIALIRENYGVARLLLFAGADAAAALARIPGGEQEHRERWASLDDTLPRALLFERASYPDALAYAVRAARDAGMVREILTLGRAKREHIARAVEAAAHYEDAEILLQLLMYHRALSSAPAAALAVPFSTRWTVLAAAASCGHLNIVQSELRELRAAAAATTTSDSVAAGTINRVVSAPDTTALSLAVRRERAECVAELLLTDLLDATSLYGALRAAHRRLRECRRGSGGGSSGNEQSRRHRNGGPRRHDDREDDAPSSSPSFDVERVIELLDRVIECGGVAAVRDDVLKYRDDAVAALAARATNATRRTNRTAAGRRGGGGDSGERASTASAASAGGAVPVAPSCPVCLDEFTAHGDSRPMLGGACGHSLCARCNAVMDRCPLCRRAWNRAEMLNVDLVALLQA